jgi:tetratricopeptide (TPR) repeat protein
MFIEPVTEEFIGREREIEFLSKWLADADAPSIVYVHDELEAQEKKGGIGKTLLLDRLLNLTATQFPNVVPVAVDFFNVMDRDGVVIVGRLIEALQQKFPRWEPESFQRLLQEYHEATLRGLAETANMRERLGDAFADDLRLLQLRMREENVYVLLFFDTFELIERHPIGAVLDPAHTFPDLYQSNRIRAIIAGRNPPDWSHPNWAGREKEALVYPLPPFTPEETIEYLKVHCYVYDVSMLSDKMLQALYRRSEGRPILVGLLVDVLNKRIKTPETLISISRSEFEASLVEEINNFDDPSRWAIFSMAHIYHRFNATLLKLFVDRPGLKGLVPEMMYQELITALPQLSFVRRSTYSDDFVLHDEMRRLVNRYCWEKQDPDQRIRRDLSLLAVEYYMALLAQEQEEEVRQSYIAETLFHKLFIDVTEGIQYFAEYFYGAVELSLRSFARTLFQELHKFREQMTHEQRQSILMAEGKLLREELNWQESLRIYEEIEQDQQWAKSRQVEILNEKSSCYVQLGLFAEAEACVHACLELERTGKDRARYARFYNLLGYIYRRRGQYAEAMSFYEECIKIQRNLDDTKAYAATLNNMGNVLRFQNKLEDALRYCKLALRLRRDLYKQGKLREVEVGLSLSTIGHIYFSLDEMVETERFYQEAYSIYKRFGDKRTLAASYVSLGNVHFRKGELEKALSDYQQAARLTTGARYEAAMDSISLQGRVLAAMGRWHDAIQCFESALELAYDIGQNRETAEILLDLAQALDYVGLDASRQVKEAKRVARKNNYQDLLGRASEIQGDSYYRRQEYQSAFKHYRVACRFMALRGSPIFDKFLRKLNDVLLDVPGNFLPGVVDLMLEYWYAMGLDQEYPQPVNTCKEVIRHMILY